MSSLYTRRHYKDLLEVVAGLYNNDRWEVKHKGILPALVGELSDHFANDNDNFNAYRFITYWHELTD